MDASTPVPVAGDLVFESLDANRHTCGLTTEGKAYCWGDNDQHRLGTGTPGLHTTPTPVQGDLRFASIHVGTRVSCGITPDGEAYCWGSGAELGTRSEGPHVDPEPAPVAGGLLFQSLAIGYHHACGVTVDGMGYCWGSGLTGALGDGRPGPLHSEREPIPIEVPGSTRFSSVGSAVNHSCAWAVDPEPTLYCWGGHGSPALVGRGPSPDRLPGPVLLPGPTG